MSELVKIYKALGDESRLRILRVLVGGRFSVNELTFIVDMGQSRVSRHLKLLVEAGLARVHREGTWAYYEAVDGKAAKSVAVQLEVVRNQAIELPDATADEDRRLQCLEQRRAKSRAFHERVATKWSRLRSELMSNTTVTEKVLDSFTGASVVADLGCGAGELLVGLAKRADRVIGVDSSPAMLEQASKLLQGSGEQTGNIELRLGAIEHLPLADSEAEAALLNMVLHHLADPLAVIQEVRRTLVPGGKLTVCDLVRHDQEWMRDKYGDQWLGFTEEELGRFFEQSKFRTVSVEQFENPPHAGIVVAVALASNQGGMK
jgi:ArsR family transcriptional regulator